MPAIYSINKIFSDHKEAYLKKHPHTSIKKRNVIAHLSECRTPEMGFRIYRCGHCHHEQIINNSCRDRHCPQCQNMKKEQWIQSRKNEVLPFTYYHIVFTLPGELSQIVYQNKKAMFTLMFDAVNKTLQSNITKEKYLGAAIGFFAILHTWGQKLNFHPHIHCVVPGGGYSETKQAWIHAPNSFLVPIEVLRSNFTRPIANFD